MLKKSLINKLYLYSMHLGHIEEYNTDLNYYCLGKRYLFNIIDINKSFFLLKKAIFFIKNLSLNNGSILYYYSRFTSLNILNKCFLLSISKEYGQQLIRFNWIYGSISNYFFSFYIFINKLTKTWFNNNNYLFNNDKKQNIYYNYSFDESQYTFFNYLFTRTKNGNLRHNYSYNKWYNQWILFQNKYDFWKYKKKSLKKTNFLKQLCLNDFNNVWKKKKLFNFRYLFIKLFYYINLEKTDPFFWDLEKEYANSYDLLHKRFISYWRFLIYFKYFNNFFQLPDAFFSIFPDRNNLPIREFTSTNLVSLGIVDTNCSLDSLHYPIISNDDSLIIIFFYFTLFSNIYMENKVDIYNNLKYTN